jgi:molybdate transport system permease protein
LETYQHLWPPVRLTLELATIGTLCLLILATPLGWWLARSKRAWKEVIATLVSLPLVLPPTVLGFYMLIALGPDGPGGMFARLWGARTLAFTFQGLVIGCIVSALPVVVQPIRNAFAAIGDRPLEAAATCGRRHGKRSGRSHCRSQVLDYFLRRCSAFLTLSETLALSL